MKSLSFECLSSVMSLPLIVARLVLAGVLGAAGYRKLRTVSETRSAMVEFGVPRHLLGFAVLGVPLVEMVLAVGLLVNASAPWAAAAAMALMLAFTIAVAGHWMTNSRPLCPCLGAHEKRRVDGVVLIRNVALLTIAMVLVVHLLPFSSIRSEVVFGLLWLSLLATVIWVSHLLVRRLTEVEEAATALAAARETSVRSDWRVERGEAAPPFALPASTGDTVSLPSLLEAGLPLLLLFTTPGCGQCNQLATDVSRWRRDFRDAFDVVVVSWARGSSGDGPFGQMLLDERRTVSGRYGIHVTPSALFVERDGAVGSAVHSGIDAIQMLIARRVRT